MANERFSYQVIEIKPAFWGGNKTLQVQDELNRLGQQGWQLVSAVQSNPMHPLRLYLKKAL